MVHATINCSYSKLKMFVGRKVVKKLIESKFVDKSICRILLIKDERKGIGTLKKYLIGSMICF